MIEWWYMLSRLHGYGSMPTIYRLFCLNEKPFLLKACSGARSHFIATPFDLNTTMLYARSQFPDTLTRI